MRALWSGSIGFGLVNIPVRLFSATYERGLNFDMLHKTDLGRIHYSRVCSVEDKVVSYDEIVKGYEYEKGKYVVLTDKDFEKVNVEKCSTISIVSFVDQVNIDPVYFEKPYFLEPGKNADRAFVILRDALEESKKVGIATYVLREREHIGVLRAYDDFLVLNQLRYADEIRKPVGLRRPDRERISKNEQEIAETLIQHLSTPFKIEEYKDEYRRELLKMIRQKASGKQPKVKGAKPQPTPVNDLMNQLMKSLERERAKTRSDG